MMDKVLCPWCGAEMRLLPFNACGGWGVDFKQWIDKMSVSYQCSICFAKSPTAWANTTNEAKERALSAALRRYVEPNRVLTVEECAALDPDGATCVESSSGEIETQLNQEIINETSGMIKMYGLQDAKKRYGKYGRCWLRRPTDDERQSVAWEESQ